MIVCVDDVEAWETPVGVLFITDSSHIGQIRLSSAGSAFVVTPRTRGRTVATCLLVSHLPGPARWPLPTGEGAEGKSPLAK